MYFKKKEKNGWGILPVVVDVSYHPTTSGSWVFKQNISLYNVLSTQNHKEIADCE